MTCSKCFLDLPLAPANISRKTGTRLYRSWCVSCEKQRKAKWVQDNLPHILEKTKEYQAQHPEQVRNTKKKWAANNKEYHLEYRRKARKENPEQYRAMVSARRRKLRCNQPPWAKRKDLVEFYRKCPPGHHVDHIIPLRGELVSGLHVLENLQYLPAKENLQKSNRYEIKLHNH